MGHRIRMEQYSNRADQGAVTARTIMMPPMVMLLKSRHVR